MGCILSLLAGIGHCNSSIFLVTAARAWVGYLYVTTDHLTNAFGSVIWPLVGFVFMPLSTLAYTWAVTDPRGTTVPHMLLVGMCALDEQSQLVCSHR